MFRLTIAIACFLLVLALKFGPSMTATSTRHATASLSTSSVDSSRGWTLYDRDPNHVWNQLYRALYQRVARDGKEYGYDELDPLLWFSTKYLLKNPASQQANIALDEFLAAEGEKMIADPLKRAILQRDLWAIFDWTTESEDSSPEKLTLQNKLAQVVKRVALSPAQIAALPNTYRQAIESKAYATAYDSNRHDLPFLPPDLFDPRSPWVMLSIRGPDRIAPEHVTAFSGRSVFLILIRLPDGRDSTLEYLKNLSAFPKPWILDPETRRPMPNSDLPQFPRGTQLALVRSMVLIDNQGEFKPTKIVEDVQIRAHRTIPREIPEALNTDRNEARAALDGYEFKLSRARLFAGEDGGLRSLTKEDTEFPLFRSHGIDLFEEASQFPLEGQLRVSLQFCANCHFRPGVHSMLSRARLQSVATPELGQAIPSWDLNYEANITKSWKARQYNWGLLKGLWRSQP